MSNLVCACAVVRVWWCVCVRVRAEHNNALAEEREGLVWACGRWLASARPRRARGTPKERTSKSSAAAGVMKQGDERGRREGTVMRCEQVTRRGGRGGRGGG
jgi:hypothetical protein